MTGIFGHILGFCILLLALAGCQEATSATVSTATETSSLVDLPSISEIAGTPGPAISPLPTLDANQIAAGKEIYETHCASCHGENLEGEADWRLQNEDGSFRAPPHDESGHTWHHADKLLEESVAKGGARLPTNIGGISNMPAFGEVLTEREIASVLAYIKSSWPEDIRQIQWEMSARQP
jgi:mono/diheme cytochrome c family protein